MKPVKVGILGLGTVGGGTVNVLKRNAAEIARRAGREIIITRASAKDLNKQRICDTQGIALTTDPFEIINDPEIEIILELIGGAGQVK
ncbi:MAG: homoserine dehydrogenase, partial [Methylobacter sp.]